MPIEGKTAYFFDTDPKRLCVRVTANGAKSYVFAGKLRGTPLRITIGSTSIWTLDDARREARRLQTTLDNGDDPREIEAEKQKQREAKSAQAEAAKREQENNKRYTLRALCEAYSDLLEKCGKTQSARQTRSIFKCHLYEAHPDVAALPAREVSDEQIADIIRAVNDQGKARTAGILRSYISAAFNTAAKARLSAKLPALLKGFGIRSNPVLPIETIPVSRGERTLTTNELAAYMNALGNDLTDQALRLALYAGGQRMAQLLRAKVSDYDKTTHTLRLWDGKGKRSTPREHLLPLGTKGQDIVNTLINRANELFTPLLFSSHGKTQLAETTPGKRVSRISKSMKGNAFDLRDIRRTCETMLAGMGISRDTRAQLLSHGISGVQAAHYDRHDYFSEKRNALIAWERRLNQIASGKTNNGNVTPITRKNTAA